MLETGTLHVFLRSRKFIFIVLIALFCSIPFKEVKAINEWKFTRNSGFSFKLRQNGIGLGGFSEWKVGTDNIFHFEMAWIDVSGEKEIRGVDYWGNPVVINEKSLVFFPIILGLKHGIFYGQLDNNFIPYIGVSGGPLLAMDAPEEGSSLSSRWRKSTPNWTWNLSLFLGADFPYTRKNIFSVGFGFNLLTFSEDVDGSRDYSGAIVFFNVGVTK
jgi:hypothetical protein